MGRPRRVVTQTLIFMIAVDLVRAEVYDEYVYVPPVMTRDTKEEVDRWLRCAGCDRRSSEIASGWSLAKYHVGIYVNAKQGNGPGPGTLCLSANLLVANAKCAKDLNYFVNDASPSMNRMVMHANRYVKGKRWLRVCM